MLQLDETFRLAAFFSSECMVLGWETYWNVSDREVNAMEKNTQEYSFANRDLITLTYSTCQWLSTIGAS